MYTPELYSFIKKIFNNGYLDEEYKFETGQIRFIKPSLVLLKQDIDRIDVCRVPEDSVHFFLLQKFVETPTGDIIYQYNIENGYLMDFRKFATLEDIVAEYNLRHCIFGDSMIRFSSLTIIRKFQEEDNKYGY